MKAAWKSFINLTLTFFLHNAHMVAIRHHGDWTASVPSPPGPQQSGELPESRRGIVALSYRCISLFWSWTMLAFSLIAIVTPSSRRWFTQCMEMRYGMSLGSWAATPFLHPTLTAATLMLLYIAATLLPLARPSSFSQLFEEKHTKKRS